MAISNTIPNVLFNEVLLNDGNNVSIILKYNTPIRSYIDYGIGSYTNTTTQDSLTYFARFELTGLTPGNTYMYRVVMTNYFGTTLSKEYTFNLPAITGTHRTYHVSPSGSDTDGLTLATAFKTITKAITTIVGGDTILIHAGTYSGGIYLDKSGTYGHTTQLLADTGVILNGTVTISGNYLKFSGFNIGTNGITAGGSFISVLNCTLDGISFNNTTNIKIENNIFTGMWPMDGWENTQKNVIKNNRLVGFNGQGITYDGIYNIIDGNYIEGDNSSTSRGITTGGGSYDKIQNNTIKNCERLIRHDSQYVYGTIGSHSTYYNNYLDNPFANDNGWDIYSGNYYFIIDNNTTLNSGFLKSGINWIITNNYFKNNLSELYYPNFAPLIGPDSAPQGGDIYEWNIFDGYQSVCFLGDKKWLATTQPFYDANQTYDSNVAIIRHNIFINLRRNIGLINMFENPMPHMNGPFIVENNVFYNLPSGFSMDDVSNVSIKNNIFDNTFYAVKARAGTGLSLTYNNSFNNTYLIAPNSVVITNSSNISLNPQFASLVIGTEDFHLKSTFGRWNGTSWVKDTVHSPCIDAGDPINSASKEPVSTASARIDIGIYGNTPEASYNGNPLNSGTISGNVKNTLGINISGVIVSDGTRSSTTDSSGNYTINNVPVGIYNLTATSTGYQSLTISNVQVIADTITTVNFNLIQICPTPICNIIITQV